MQWLKLFFTLRRPKQIAIVVWGVHFLALFSLGAHHFIASFFAKKPHPIAVRTFRPKPPPQVVAPQVAAPAKTVKAALKPAAVAAAPAPVKKKTAPKKKEAAPKDKDFEALVKQLDTIAPPQPAKRKELPVPAKIEPVFEEKKEAPVYADFLISYLQEALDLPEFGEVIAKLEIDRFGHLVACTILEAKSEKNGEFLKKRLPELVFPCFNDFGLSDSALAFTVVFKNET